MHEVTISSQFRIVIPKAVRERLQLRAGQKLGVLIKGGTVSLVQVRPIQELKGIANGGSMGAYREHDDRL